MLLNSWKSKVLKLSGLAVLVGGFALPLSAQAEDDVSAFIEIVIGGNRHDRPDGRVERLERAVRQLQNRVYQLEEEVYSRQGRRRPLSTFVCSLRDDLHGEVFIGRASTQVEAAAKASQACVSARRNGIWCDDNPAVCERE